MLFGDADPTGTVDVWRRFVVATMCMADAERLPLMAQGRPATAELGGPGRSPGIPLVRVIAVTGYAVADGSDNR